MRTWLLALVLTAALPALGSEKIPDAGSTDAATPEKRVKAGRALFQKKKYAAALAEFKFALQDQPDNRDTRFLCGLAAYWSHNPEQALDYWNPLYDTAARNSDDEWELARNRVMALSAVSPDAAASCVERLYDLHRSGKVKAAAAARGFVREHIYHQSLRAGAWQVFDERGEVQELWTFPVIDAEAKDEPLVKMIAVRVALMPGGTAGFALTEEVRGFQRVYKRWAQKPRYEDVRPLVLEIIQSTARPLEEKTADNAEDFPEVGKAEPPAASAQNTIQGLDAGVAAMNLSPEAARIVNIASRLREVDFDVTRLTRLSLTDPDLAERQMKELAARSPHAQDDASEFVELVSKTSKEHAVEAYGGVVKLGARKPYFDFALLTAINTRGSETPSGLLEEIARSKDLVVRQTALVIIARQGKREALESLLAEVKEGDATSANILLASLQELLGASFPPAPPAGSTDEAALKKWRAAVDEWWKARGDKLQFDAEPKPDQPFWK